MNCSYSFTFKTTKMAKLIKPSPNDQKSNVKNPNNPAFKAATDNRSVQLNTTPPPPPPKKEK
jgi:hypothetical protein